MRIATTTGDFKAYSENSARTQSGQNAVRRTQGDAERRVQNSEYARRTNSGENPVRRTQNRENARDVSSSAARDSEYRPRH